ncbi:hypothetical protein [Indioceanicola profundi]|uniref:hypothetical protein n=1 Tax=Indioceanicola profundi TaxID=2220096 RepID=UPI0013C4AFCB|nr:hypothetical protein [Indioceanicola profundi]
MSKKLTSLLPAAVVLLLASASSAQQLIPPVTVELEGEMVSINKVDGGYNVKVMGSTVFVPSNLPVQTPTASMPASVFFAISDNLPGIKATQYPSGGPVGFLGGTAIVTGTQTYSADESAKITAETFFTDYHENVLLGGVTHAPSENPKANLYVGNMPVIPLGKDESDKYEYDSRYPGLPIQNEYGFKVEEDLPIGALTSVEGYMDDDGVMRAFLIEVDAGKLANATKKEVSVLRVQCRQRSNTNIELSVSGAAHGAAENGLGNTHRVRLTSAEGGVWYSTATGTTPPSAALTIDGENAMYYLYSYSFKGTPTGRRGCPTKVTATLLNSGTPVTDATATADVDLRID